MDTHQALHTAPTQEALFQDMLLDAEHSAHIELAHDVEGYLVYLMMRFLRGNIRLNGAIALHYMEAAQQRGSARVDALSDTGDACLLLAGLFPEQARHRMVNVGYFARIGQDCYRFLAGCTMASRSEMYHALDEHFGDMLGVLRTLHHQDRQDTGHHVMDAYELWQHSNCRIAFDEMHTLSGAIPVRHEQQYIY